MFRNTRFLLTAMFAAGALSQAQQCTTPDGSIVPDGPVSANATFLAQDHAITVTLTNTLADPKSAGQLLSGLAFTVSDGETAGTLSSSSAIIRQVKKGGSSVDSGPSATGWALADNFNGGLELCVLCTNLGGVGPSHLLIGPPASDGNYDSANGSIGGNKPHNPLTAGTATFVLSVPGVTPASTVTSATFFFSTTEGISVSGTCGGGRQ